MNHVDGRDALESAYDRGATWWGIGEWRLTGVTLERWRGVAIGGRIMSAMTTGEELRVGYPRFLWGCAQVLAMRARKRRDRSRGLPIARVVRR